MVRRSQQSKQSTRRAERAAEASRKDGEVHGGYKPPPRSECTEHVFYMPLDDDGIFQVEQRTWTNGRLVDFHLIASAMQLKQTDWYPLDVVRVDICHGHAHAHMLAGPNVNAEPLHIRRIDGVDDVQPAFHAASIQIIDLASRVEAERGTA
jgi:hypothetical protein